LTLEENEKINLVNKVFMLFTAPRGI